MKKILLSLILALHLFGDDIVVYNNEYNVLTLDKQVKKLIVGNKEMINVSLLNASSKEGTLLKIFGKKSGNTSILLMYRDGSIQNYHVYVNQNLGFIQKMINIIEPNLALSRVGDGSTVISGSFKNPHDKKRIYALLKNGGIDLNKLMDLTTTTKVNKMVRTKLYLVEINNNKAKDMGGVTGLGFFNEYIDASINPLASNSATFSGWLLDNTAAFSSSTGNSVTGTLNFLATNGLGKILDDTVLMTTEDENASFRVGGDVYIPTGITQNDGESPTIQVELREYGLELSLTSAFMEKEGYIHINVGIEDSDFDTDTDHDVSLGEGVVIPSFVSKNIATNVVVKSGQVIVLGGRLHTEDTTSEESVPFFSDIPVIGELFKHTVTNEASNDLLFFLVPEIIDANEEIDDTNFYKDFKDESQIFHKEVIDTNSSIDKRDSLVMINESNTTQKSALHLTPTKDELVVIELEEETPDQEEILDEAPIQEITHLQESSQKPQENYYNVTAERIFLRSKPVDGERLDIWKKGHKFTIGEEKNIDGTVWMRVEEDCLNKCQPLLHTLWISKRYVELQ